MSTISPRESVQKVTESTPVMIGLGIVFLALTAVSIVGGFIFFLALLIAYQIFLALFPGPARNRHFSHR
ncbi:MAG: hypothetical protein IPK16_05260 [Anaerolineales bacterium]|nr:hypothetical protein [Anaerolineales bacterium]